MVGYAGRPCRVPEDCHSTWVTIKSVYVGLHPSQRHCLVPQAVVALQKALCGAQKAEQSEAVMDEYDNRRAVGHQSVHGRLRDAGYESSPVEIDHDAPSPEARQAGNIDIQVKTVLADGSKHPNAIARWFDGERSVRTESSADEGHWLGQSEKSKGR